MWGVWIIGGFRNAATSCGGGPEVTGWALDRWLICDCCCERSDSSLSERRWLAFCDSEKKVLQDVQAQKVYTGTFVDLINAPWGSTEVMVNLG
jgi:hypothetical protein